MAIALIFSPPGGPFPREAESGNFSAPRWMQTESSSCGYAEKDGKTLAGEILTTDGQHENTRQVPGQEYSP
jgi:hypothetical protein